MRRLGRSSKGTPDKRKIFTGKRISYRKAKKSIFKENSVCSVVEIALTGKTSGANATRKAPGLAMTLRQ
jgi:hypothetical protein